MHATQRTFFELSLRMLVRSYEELLEIAPNEVLKLARLGRVPPDQVFLVVFHEQLAEERKNAKFTWPRSDDWLRFETHKKVLFAYEKYQPVSYSTPSDLGYVTRPASECYDHLFWTVYHELGGDTNYKTPEELIEKFNNLVSGLRVLELGCGPGFALHVLEQYGAQCKGIDIRNLGVPEIFRPEVGDARKLSSFYDAEEFDLIISHDFFCEVIVSQEDSGHVLRGAHHVLKPGGRMIHEINFFRMDAPIYYVINYLILKSQRKVRDIDDYIDIIFNSGETITPQWNNKLSLRIDDCVAMGLAGFEIQPEAEYLTVVLRK